MNIIKALLKWLWKWEKGSERRFHGEPTQRYLGAREKSMLDDVRNFLQEIRMQDKLPNIIKRHSISVEEFKRLEDLSQLYHQAREKGNANARRELFKRYPNNTHIFETVRKELVEYNRIKEEMHNEGEDFVEHPDEPNLRSYTVDHPMSEIYRRTTGIGHQLDVTPLSLESTDIMSPEHRAEYEQISDIQRRWSELAMEDVPQTDERTQALERVRTMMGNARRISGDMDRVSRELGPSQARQMFDATQWISRSNEELDSIRSGDYRNWADRHSEPEPPEVDPREELGREFLDRLGRNFSGEGE